MKEVEPSNDLDVRYTKNMGQSGLKRLIIRHSAILWTVGPEKSKIRHSPIKRVNGKAVLADYPRSN